MAHVARRRRGVGCARAGRRACRSRRSSARRRGPMPAYNSNGLGLMPPPALADEAEKLLAGGFRAVKLRLGYADARGRPRRGARRARAHRRRRRADGRLQPGARAWPKRCGAGARSTAKACTGSRSRCATTTTRGCARARGARSRRRCRSARISRRSTTCRKRSTARACDYVMPDLERIGGVTGWQRASALAAARRYADVLAPVSRDQRASARRDADRALARVRRLAERRSCDEPLRSSTAWRGRPSGRASGSRGTRTWCAGTPGYDPAVLFVNWLQHS